MNFGLGEEEEGVEMVVERLGCEGRTRERAEKIVDSRELREVKGARA